MRRRLLAAAVVVAAGCGGVAACSDDLPTGPVTVTTDQNGDPVGAGESAPGGVDDLPDEAGYDTCDLVPVEMVNRNIGLDLPEGGLRDQETDTRICQYGEFSFNGDGDFLVTVYVGDTTAQATGVFDDVVFVVSARPVAGIGDEAAEAPFSSRFVVRQGNVVVDVYGESGQARLGADDAELQALALEILGTAAETFPGADTGATPAP